MAVLFRFFLGWGFGFGLVVLLACFEAVQIFCIITCRFTLQSSKSCNDRQRPELDGHRHQKKKVS